MNTTSLMKYAGAVGALAICAACGGGSSVAPSTAVLNGEHIGRAATADGRLSTAARPNLNALLPYPTIVPDQAAKSKSKYFEYVISFYGSFASIFNYPKSHNQIGTINNVGGQGCTNVLYGYGKKTFWIVAGSDQITEYQVPQKPIKTLSVPSSSMPSSCAMNTVGDLAVGILDGANSGAVAIFKHASGSPKFIGTPLGREYFDGYDPQGNLFFDGFTPGSSFQLDEIPKGTNTVKTIATSNTILFPGSVQWDGTYMTVFDQRANNLYRYSISGTKANLKGTVSFSGSSDCAQTWIATGVVYCGDAGNDNGSVFKYPAGGKQLAVFTGSFDEPLGVVAAKK